MTILRDTLYSDKVLAVIREYSANAWDAARSRRDYAGRCSTAKGVHVRPETRLVIRDTTSRVALSPHDTVVRGVVTQQTLLDGLAAAVGDAGLPHRGRCPYTGRQGRARCRDQPSARLLTKALICATASSTLRART